MSDKSSQGVNRDIAPPIYEQIELERLHQLFRWGDQKHTPGEWLLILQEEIGEASKEFLQENSERGYRELVQAAAVIVAWIEQLAMEES